MSPITIFFIIGKESISFVSTAHIYWRTERGLSWFTLHDISQILYHGICKILGKMDYINNGHKAWPDCRTNPSVGSAYIVILITANQRSCWKVMYSVLSLCHSVCSQGRDVSMRPPCMVISYRSHGNPPLHGRVQTCLWCSPDICWQTGGWHSTEVPSRFFNFWLLGASHQSLENQYFFIAKEFRSCSISLSLLKKVSMIFLLSTCIYNCTLFLCLRSCQ